MRNDGKRGRIPGFFERRLREIASRTGRLAAMLPGIHMSHRECGLVSSRRFPAAKPPRSSEQLANAGRPCQFIHKL